MRIRLLLVGAIAGSLLPLGSANAGGGHWVFDGDRDQIDPAFVAGESVRATTSLWLEGVKPDSHDDVYWAGPHHGPFFGYVVARDIEGGPYPPQLPEGAVQVGDVVFSETPDDRVLDVTLDFVVPDLEPGFYSLLHCNDPCTRQIGDTMTTAFTIVEDDGQAFIAGRVTRMQQRLRNLPFRIRNSFKDDLRAITTRLERRISTLETRVLALGQTDVPTATEQSSSSVPTESWIALGAGGMLAILGGGRWAARALKGRRRLEHSI